jgi:hypothetical protein
MRLHIPVISRAEQLIGAGALAAQTLPFSGAACMPKA